MNIIDWFKDNIKSSFIRSVEITEFPNSCDCGSCQNYRLKVTSHQDKELTVVAGVSYDSNPTGYVLNNRVWCFPEILAVIDYNFVVVQDVGWQEGKYPRTAEQDTVNPNGIETFFEETKGLL